MPLVSFALAPCLRLSVQQRGVCTVLYPEIWWTSIIHQVCLSVLHYTERYGGLLLYTRYVCLYCIIPRDMVDFYYTPGMSVCTVLYPEIWWTSIIHQVCLSVLHYTQRYGGLLLYTRYVCLYCIIPRDMVDFYYTPGMSVCTVLYPEIWWTSIIHQVCLSVLYYTQRYGGLLLYTRYVRTL